MPFPKIMRHPYKEQIVKMLLEGKGVRYVEKHLKELWPDDPKFHVTANTLQAFRKEHLKLDGEVLDKLKKKELDKAFEKERKIEHKDVKKMATYKEKVHEAVNVHIDIRKSLGELDGLIKERLSEFFDRAQSGKASILEEKLLQGYFDRYFMLIDKWAKYVDKLADIRVETNVNITMIQDQMAALRRVVLKVLNSMDPEAALRFMDEVSREMSGMSYDKTAGTSFEDIRAELKALPAEIIETEVAE